MRISEKWSKGMLAGYLLPRQDMARKVAKKGIEIRPLPNSPCFVVGIFDGYSKAGLAPSARLPSMTAQKNKSPLLQAAIALMEARNVGMVTSEQWENLAKAVEAESGEKIEWCTDDEIADAEEKAG